MITQREQCSPRKRRDLLIGLRSWFRMRWVFVLLISIHSGTILNSVLAKGVPEPTPPPAPAPFDDTFTVRCFDDPTDTSNPVCGMWVNSPAVLDIDINSGDAANHLAEKSHTIGLDIASRRSCVLELEKANPEVFIGESDDQPSAFEQGKIYAPFIVPPGCMAYPLGITIVNTNEVPPDELQSIWIALSCGLLLAGTTFGVILLLRKRLPYSNSESTPAQSQASTRSTPDVRDPSHPQSAPTESNPSRPVVDLRYTNSDTGPDHAEAVLASLRVPARVESVSEKPGGRVLVKLAPGPRDKSSKIQDLKDPSSTLGRNTRANIARYTGVDNDKVDIE